MCAVSGEEILPSVMLKEAQVRKLHWVKGEDGVAFTKGGSFQTIGKGRLQTQGPYPCSSGPRGLGDDCSSALRVERARGPGPTFWQDLLR